MSFLHVNYLKSHIRDKLQHLTIIGVKMKTKYFGLIGLCVILSSQVFGEFSAREFFNKEDKRTQVSTSPAMAIVGDTMAALFSKSSHSSAHQKLLNYIEYDLSELTSKQVRLRKQLYFIVEYIDELKIELETIEKTHLPQALNSTQYPGLYQRLQANLEHKIKISKELINLGEEISLKRKALFINPSEIADPRFRKSAQLQKRIKVLSLFGVFISLSDIAGQIAIEYHSPEEADYVPGEGVWEAIEYLLLNNEDSSIDQHLDKADQLINEIEEKILEDEV